MESISKTDTWYFSLIYLHILAQQNTTSRVQILENVPMTPLWVTWMTGFILKCPHVHRCAIPAMHTESFSLYLLPKIKIN
jgi:hypothetical protein